MKLVPALSQYCRMEGETSSDFVKQLKALTPEDKQWFKDQFGREGIPIEDN